MQQISSFQIIVLGICAALLLLGIGVFAASGGLTHGTKVGNVTIWGTLDASQMQNAITSLANQDKSFQSVTYVQKKESTYSADLTNAIAAGNGPDLFLVSQDEIESFADKIYTIPYSAVSQGTFTSSFIDEAQMLLTPQGELGLPLTIDPLVMYWNHDLFATAGLANPPKYWNDFLDLAPKITSLDTGSNVTRSAVALGEWGNIPHAKDILSMLFIQAGDPIISENSDGSLLPVFGTKPQGATTNPSESALQFYTEFANPSKTSYSWNRALPVADQAFSAGDVGVYFGFASEYGDFVQSNPNLHFSVAVVPQIEGGGVQATFGQMNILSIPHGAANPTGALTIAEKLSSHDGIVAMVQATGLPPVRRDVTVDTSANANASVFEQSALIAHAWLDPNPASTDPIFQTMIESVVSGQNAPGQAVSDASEALQTLLSH